MALDRTDVEQLAKLTHIALSEEDALNATDKLSGILGLIDQLQAVNTEDIEPLAHPLEITQRLRPDTVTETNQREALQSIAPATEQGLYLVPRVIE